MPIPAPNKGESKDKFIPRCMSSEVMMKEFPESKQRFAVCSQKWRDMHKKSSAEQDNTVVEELIEAFLQRHPELIIKE